MAIKLTTNLDVRTALPVDTRFTLTKTEMYSMKDTLMPEVYFTICKEDSKIYVYNKNNPVDLETGKFRVYEAGGGGGTDTDTKYRIRSTGTNKWQLEQSNDGISWSVAEGTIDLSIVISSLKDQISAEELARKSKDTEIEGKIVEEAEARIEADAYLQEEIDNLPQAAEYTIVEKTPGTGFTASYRLTKNSEEIGVPINVPEPQVIKEVSVKVCVEKDVPIEGLNPGDKYIDFEWGNSTHSYIDIKQLVVLYKAGAGITISQDNIISVNTDDNSIITVTNGNHLSIKGYEEAKQGQMLVKDSVEGLAWIDPLSEERLQQAVANAEHSASEAANQAVVAGNKAIEADTSAKTAQRINEVTMQYVNDKLWWGDVEEYNKLEEINEGTFYFVQM